MHLIIRNSSKQGKNCLYGEAEFSKVLMLVIMPHLLTVNSYW